MSYESADAKNQRIAERLKELKPPPNATLIEVVAHEPDPSLVDDVYTELREALGSCFQTLVKACDYESTEWRALRRSQLSSDERLGLRASIASFVLVADEAITVRPLGWKLFEWHQKRTGRLSEIHKTYLRTLRIEERL